MSRGLILLLIVLVGCATSPMARKLSDEERLRYGLTGIAFDIPLCPTKDDKVTGACELVTCEMEKGKIVCRAIPQKDSK